MAGAPIQDLFRQKLLSCYWRFGPGWGEAKTDRFTFLADGGIGNYDHPNERRWALNNGRLEIFGRADVGGGEPVCGGFSVLHRAEDAAGC